MKRYIVHVNGSLFMLVLFLAIATSGYVFTRPVGAAAVTGFNAGNIMDDSVFTRKNSMTAAQIQSFLNSKVPNCDTNGTQTSEYGGGTRAQYGASKGYPKPYKCLRNYTQGGKTAAKIIYDAAQEFSINPQVLIVLLQKEQGLVTDTWPWSIQYRSATGYGCPDSAACDSTYYGFTNQVRWSARMFRAILNQSPNWYTPYELGSNRIYWHPDTARCGSSTVNIQNLSTVALYSYTPYRPNQSALNAGYGNGNSCGSYGNRNFYQYFKDWFGSVRADGCIRSNNATGETSGQRVINIGSRLAFTKLNNTGSTCAEVHTWQSGFKAWASNIATNLKSATPDNKSLVAADTNDDGVDELNYIKYQSGSGRVEIHSFSTGFKKWNSNIVTNLSNIDPIKGTILSADTDGNGADELFYVKYRSAGGKIEIFKWNRGFKSWSSTTVTNKSSIDPSFGRVIAGDLDGDGRDELHYIKYRLTGSGRVEVHTWKPGFKSWAGNYSTNLGDFSPDTREIISGNISGDRRDELMYIRYSETNSGRVEVHTWKPGFKSWASNVATNISGFNPVTK